MVILDWPTQAWNPVFLSTLVKNPIKFKPSIVLLLPPRRSAHPLAERTTLVVDRFSGSAYVTQETSNRTADILLESITESTQKKYTFDLKHW